MSVEDDILNDVKNNLAQRILETQQEISILQSRIDNRKPAIAETNNRIDDLSRTNKEDIRNLERAQNRLGKIVDLKDKLDRGDVEIKINKKR